MKTARRKPNILSASMRGLIAALLGVVLIGYAAPAAAQQRLHLEAMPDLDLYALKSAQFFPRGRDEARLSITAGSSGWGEFGLERDKEGWIEGFIDAGASWVPEAETYILVRSYAAVPWLLRGDGETRRDVWRLTGRHRFLGQLGLGDPRRDEIGLDLSVDYQMDHAGDRPLAVGRGDVGPASFHDETLTVGVWPRLSEDAEEIFTLPIFYALRDVGYHDDSAAGPGFTTHEVSSGVGVRSYDEDMLGGWAEILGVSYAQTRFHLGEAGCEEGACPPVSQSLRLRSAGDEPGLTRYERIDLRAFNIEDLTFEEADEFIMSGSFMMGGSWLWDQAADIEESFFVFHMGVLARFEYGAVGVAMSRSAIHTPDARRFAANWRIEALFSIGLDDSPFGMSIKTALDRIASAKEEKDPEDLGVIRAGLDSRWFVAPFEHGRIGFYHLAAYGPGSGSFDWWEGERGWNHELGLFLSVNYDSTTWNQGPVYPGEGSYDAGAGRW